MVCGTAVMPVVLPPLKEVELLIVGGGPAGLAAALTAAEAGVKSLWLVDENEKLGGQLFKQTHMFFGSHQHYAGVRGFEIGRLLEKQVLDSSVKVHLKTSLVGIYEDLQIALYNEQGVKIVKTKRLIVATGASENYLPFIKNDLPGVYGAGAVQTLMNIYGVIPGYKVLMIGSGNIGLIVSYQLLQAGVKVVALVEAAKEIGGYHVHAAKLRRAGVPFYMRHTIYEAIGKEEVEGATVVEVDRQWQPIPGSEKKFIVDTICLAVGLTPLADLLWQAGCEMLYLPETGGHTPLHNENLQTTVKEIYVAGDVSGIEEANTALDEGRLSGLAVAKSLGYGEKGNKIEAQMNEIKERLKFLRKGPFGVKRALGKEKLIQQLHNIKNNISI